MSSAMTGTPEPSDSAHSDTDPTEKSTRSAWTRIAGVAPLALAIIAVIAATVCVVVFGLRAYDVYANQYPAQQTRDDATQAAEQAVLNVTTIDPTDLDGFKKRAEASLTGKAKEEVLGGKDGSVLDMLSQAGHEAAKLSARLVRSAPTEVNPDEKKAKVLVYVVTTLERPGQPGVDETRGFDVSMVKDGDLWKAENLLGLEGIAYADAGQAGNGQAPAPAPGGGN
ncbi:UNVERIFIED_ORG: Mce-associated membrane protein [Gordonia westfalica J30]